MTVWATLKTKQIGAVIKGLTRDLPAICSIQNARYYDFEERRNVKIRCFRKEMECRSFLWITLSGSIRKYFYFLDFLLSRSIPISNFHSFAQIFLVDLSQKYINRPMRINANKNSDKIMALMFNDFYRFRSSIIGEHFGSAKQMVEYGIFF